MQVSVLGPGGGGPFGGEHRKSSWAVIGRGFVPLQCYGFSRENLGPSVFLKALSLSRNWDQIVPSKVVTSGLP